MAEQNLEEASNDWGMIYLSKSGYVKVTDNFTDIPSDWVARFYWTHTGITGDSYLKNGDGKRFCMDLNPRLDPIYAKNQLTAARLEMRGLIKTKDENKENQKRDNIFEKILPNLEKLIN